MPRWQLAGPVEPGLAAKQAGTEPWYIRRVVCLNCVGVTAWHELVKQLVGPSALRDQFCPEGRAFRQSWGSTQQGGKSKTRVFSPQEACRALWSGQRLGLVTSALILDPWEKRSTCREKRRGCERSGGAQQQGPGTGGPASPRSSSGSRSCLRALARGIKAVLYLRLLLTWCTCLTQNKQHNLPFQGWKLAHLLAGGRKKKPKPLKITCSCANWWHLS